MEILDSFNQKSINLDGLQNNEKLLRAMNINSTFKIILNFTNYINHFLTVTAIKFVYYSNNKGIIDKTFLAKYELKELQQLTPYFKKINSINYIYNEILKCFMDGSVDLFENKNGITIIFTISNFGDYNYNYKIPFLLLPYIETPQILENSDKIEEVKIDDSQINNNNTMIGNKRVRNSENLEKEQNKIAKKDNIIIEEKKVNESIDINEKETQNNQNTFDNV